MLTFYSIVLETFTLIYFNSSFIYRKYYLFHFNFYYYYSLRFSNSLYLIFISLKYVKLRILLNYNLFGSRTAIK